MTLLLIFNIKLCYWTTCSFLKAPKIISFLFSFSELSDTSLIWWSLWMLGLLVLMLIKPTGSSSQYLWWKFCWSFIHLDLKNFLWDFGICKCINLNTHYFIYLIDSLSYPRIFIWFNQNTNTANKCGHTNVSLFYLYCPRILGKKMILI